MGEEFNGRLEDAMRYIHRHMWGTVPQELNADFREHIEKFRRFLPPLVARAQLYSLYGDEQSRVDYEIEQMVSKGQIKVIKTISGDLVISTDNYLEAVNGRIVDDTSLAELLQVLRDWTQESSDTLVAKEELPFTEEQLKTLVGMEYFSLIPGDLEHVSVSFPRVGFVLQLQQKSKTFIMRALNAQKWKELKQEDLLGKWNKNKARFKDFKGLSLNWSLHWLIGDGMIEAFQTGDSIAFKII